jgi:hypothetical protein
MNDDYNELTEEQVKEIIKAIIKITNAKDPLHIRKVIWEVLTYFLVRLSGGKLQGLRWISFELGLFARRLYNKK